VYPLPLCILSPQRAINPFSSNEYNCDSSFTCSALPPRS
jgi:hypothetical protein